MPYPILPLQELGEISQGLLISRYQEQEDEEGSSERIVNVRDLESLHIGSNLDVVQINVSECKRYQLDTNDVVIAIRGVSQKASVVTADAQGSIAGQNVAFFRPKSGVINSVYLAVLMRSQWIERSLSMLSGQSIATRFISIAQLRDLKIPLPDLATQGQIAQLFLSTEHATKITLEALETRRRLTEFTLFKILEG